MKKLFIIVFGILCCVLFMNKIQALNISDGVIIMAKSDTCESVLGDLNNPNSFASLLQEIFDVIKFGTPILIFVLTIIEYGKAIISDDKDMLKKATSVTSKRLILGLCLFLLPIVLNFIFDLLGWYGTCGIS